MTSEKGGGRTKIIGGEQGATRDLDAACSTEKKKRQLEWPTSWPTTIKKKPEGKNKSENAAHKASVTVI